MTELGVALRQTSPPRQWRDFFYHARNRLISSPKFQRLVAAFPFTQKIAERRARAAFDLCAGFVYSQILQVCSDSGLFEFLAAHPRPSAEIARHLGLPEDIAARFLAAATSLKLIERRGARYRLGSLGAAFLGNSGIAAMIVHHAMFYQDLAEPLRLLQTMDQPTKLSQFWPYARAPHPADIGANEASHYSALMGKSQDLIIADILRGYPIDRHRTLMDIGGGEGRFAIAAALHAPCLRLKLFDLPAVVSRAGQNIAAAGLTDRIEPIGGDFIRNLLPGGADLITLIRICHDHDDAPLLRLFANIHAALVPGGTLLIAEPMASDDEDDPIADAYFGMYLIAMRSGRPRRSSELRALLTEVGFISIKSIRSARPYFARILTARCKP